MIIGGEDLGVCGNNMRVYLSHPMILYNSETKIEYLRVIQDTLGEVKIIDPSKFNLPHGSMEFYHMLIDNCDVIVYVPIVGFITAGVYDEVIYAFKSGKKVYRVKDNKLELVRDIDNIKDHILDIEATRKLYEILNIVDKYILQSELDRISKYCIDRVRALEIFIQCHLNKYLPKGISMKPENRWLHWWQLMQLNPGMRIPCDSKELRGHIRELARKYKVEETLLRRISREKAFFKHACKSIKVRTLMDVCNKLGIPYYELDQFLGYPVDLANPNLWKLAVHILNEGHIRLDSKGRLSVRYYNKDPILHYYVYKLGGKPNDMNNRVFRSYIPVEYAPRLIRIGVPPGNKTINMPNIDLGAMDNDAFKYYIQATLTEEGKFTIYKMKNKNTIKQIIGFSRSFDITKHISNPDKYINSLGYGQYPIGDIRKYDPDLYKLILSNPHPYLHKEYYELYKRNPIIGDTILFFPKTLRITKDDRITVLWCIELHHRDSVKYLYRKYGFLPDTFKDYIGRKTYEILLEYEKEGLSSQVRKMIDELHENRKRMLREWIERKKDKYFYKLKFKK